MNEFDIKINEYLGELPEETRKVLVSSRWQTVASQIAKKYSLSENQTEGMIREIWIVLIGGGDIEKFEESLREELSVSNLLSTELTEEIENKIFKPIIEKLSEKDDVSDNYKTNEIDEFRKDIPPDNLPTEYGLDEEDHSLEEKNDNYLDESLQKPEDDPETNEVLDKNDNLILEDQTEKKGDEENQLEKAEIQKDSPKPKFDFNSKLEKVTTVSKEPESKIEKSYSQDPYREPIE